MIKIKKYTSNKGAEWGGTKMQNDWLEKVNEERKEKRDLMIKIGHKAMFKINAIENVRDYKKLVNQLTRKLNILEKYLKNKKNSKSITLKKADVICGLSMNIESYGVELERWFKDKYDIMEE